MSEKEIMSWLQSYLKYPEMDDPKYIKEAIQGLLDLYNKEKEKNKTVRDRIEYYLLDNMSLENNHEKLKKELIKLKELLEE